VPIQAAPDVEPSEEIPAAEHVESSAAAFGAPVGEALEKAGGQLLQTARFYEGAAADQATNNFLEQQTKILYGDPSKPAVGPDGKPIMGPDGVTPVGDGGFYSLRGADARAAAPAVQEQIDDLITEQRAQLRTPHAQMQFETDTRRYRAAEMAKMGVFVHDQYKVWAGQVNNQGIAVTTDKIGRDLTDPAALEDDQHTLRDYFVKNDQLQYGDTPQIQQAATLKADQAFYTAQARALLVNGPTAEDGLKVLRDHEDVLSTMPSYYSDLREAQRATLSYAVGSASDPTAVAAWRAANPEATAAGTTAVAPTTDEAGYLSARASHEGWTHDPRSSAQGGFLRDTWLSTIQRHPELAAQVAGLTPDQIAAKRADHAFNDQVTLALRRDNLAILPPGVGNTNANLFAMQWFGPDGGPRVLTAPANTPIVSIIGADATRRNHLEGQTTGQVLARLGQQFGTTPVQAGAAGAGQAEDPYLAHVRSQLKGIFPNDPDLVESGVKTVEGNIKRDDHEGSQAQERLNGNAIKYAADPDNDLSKLGTTPDQVRTSLPNDPAKAALQADQLQGVIEFHQAYHKINTLSDTGAQAMVDSYRPTGPADYDVKEPEYEAMQKALEARRQAIAQDPAGYVRTNFPDVDRLAFQDANHGMWGNPQLFAAYASRLDATYAALGVDPGNRPLLARGVAQNIVTNVDTRSSQEAATALRQMETVAGAQWPRLFQQLRMTGLPTGLATAISLGGQDSALMITALQADATAKAEKNQTLQAQLEGRFFTIPAAGGKKAKTDSVEKLIEDTMSSDTNLAAFASAWGNTGRAGVEQFAGLNTAIKVTAQYLWLQNPTQNPVTVAQRAIGMVTGRYDFVQQPNAVPVMLPKGQAANFRLVGTASAHALTAAQVEPYPGNGPEDYRQQEAVRGARSAYWVTIPGRDGNGAIRAFDPATQQPVQLRGGHTLDIPFSQIPIYAQRIRPAINRAVNEDVQGAIILRAIMSGL
jgi:hypothetical protein